MSSEARLSRSCSSVRAPRMGAVTPGCAEAQASATCASGWSISPLTSRRASSTRQLWLVNFWSPKGLSPLSRPWPVAPAPSPAPVLAGEEAAGERAPGADAEAARAGGGQVLALDAALDERVLELQGGGSGDSVRLGQRRRPGDVPGGHVREAKIADFAGAHQVAERPQHLLNGRDAIPDVQPVEVDVVGAQPAQRALERAINVLAAVAGGVHVAWFATVEGELGGEHQPVAQAAVGDVAAQQLLATPAPVDIGGVDEISASVDIGVEDGLGDRVGGAPARGAEGHGTEGERVDDQAGATEGAKGGEAHAMSPLTRTMNAVDRFGALGGRRVADAEWRSDPSDEPVDRHDLSVLVRDREGEAAVGAPAIEVGYSSKMISASGLPAIQSSTLVDWAMRAGL